MRTSTLKRASAACIAAALFGSVTAQIIFSHRHLYNEFDSHLQFAQKLEMTGTIPVPHFLFHLVAIVAHSAVMQFAGAGYYPRGHSVDMSWLIAGVLVMLTIYGATFGLLDRYLRGAGIGEDQSIILSISLMVVSPIFILAPIDGRFYFGYLAPTIYNIPTQPLLKMMTIAVFMFTPSIAEKKASPVKLIAISLFIVLNGLSKPNFLIIMLPALAVLTTWRVARKKTINLPTIICMICSAALVLAWQYYFKFVNPDGRIYESSITFTTPFEVWDHVTGFVPLKFVLSIVFPIYVIVAYWKSAISSIEMQYSWLLFTFGAIFSAFLAETGPQKYAGNFIWSGEVAVFVLFFVSTKFLFSRPRTTSHSSRFKTAVVLLSIHVFCGIIYYIRSFWFPYR
jgi:hypothetical protein